MIAAGGARAARARRDGPLEAAIGPGAGGCCYETGEEVRERFARYGASRGRLLDLKRRRRGAAAEAGVAHVATSASARSARLPGGSSRTVATARHRASGRGSRWLR